MNIKESIKKLIRRQYRCCEGSTAIKDQKIVDSFVANPNNTFLVSFPRTGSHWLRMLMEVYFERPSLTRTFYYLDVNDYLTLHTHDLRLDVERTHVIYMYRDPVDTIYSLLKYHKENHNRVDRIEHWTDLYGQHLDKWLHQESFTELKTIIRYERLKSDMLNEFSKVCNHFDTSADAQRLQTLAARVSKEEAWRRTSHDTQVIDLAEVYAKNRERFREEHSNLVWKVLLHGRMHLDEDF